MIKQADVVLAMFLLGHAFSLEAKQRNFAFYDPLTTGDSSLSSCIEAIIAAQIGDMDKAIRYGMAALLMDLADVGGNVKDGCHIASMGGTWMMLTYGFGGMRDDDGTLSFWPRRAPEDNAILRFPLTYRGQMLEVEIGLETVAYALREGEGLVIRHETEEIQLTPEQPRAWPQTDPPSLGGFGCSQGWKVGRDCVRVHRGGREALCTDPWPRLPGCRRGAGWAAM